MPANKNAVRRYMLLDCFLSDRHNDYTRKRLYEKVRDALSIEDIHVSPRTIETDLHDMESIFGCEYEYTLKEGKRIIKYKEPSFRAFAKPLQHDEKILLYEVFNTLGQFDGLDNFEWIGELKEKLSEKDVYDFPDEHGIVHNKIISFSQNKELENRDYLSWFFYAISNKVVVRIVYSPFQTNVETEKIIYPYMLKQHNDRWYLIGTPIETEHKKYDPEHLENYPLDRIKEYHEVYDIEYKECPINIEEYYEDVIGLTNRADKEVLEIVMAIHPLSWNYARTKPLHWSQALLVGEDKEAILEQFSIPEGYVLFKIRCKDNYELRAVLRSFGTNILVLTPEKFRKEMIGDIIEHQKLYNKL